MTAFDIAEQRAAFEILPSRRQCSEWVSFIDALDHGDDGLHRFGLALGDLWMRGEQPALVGARRVGRGGQWVLKEASSLEDDYGAPPF